MIQIIFIDEGAIAQDRRTTGFFGDMAPLRAKRFLSPILQH